jgi:hypothetical protein
MPIILAIEPDRRQRDALSAVVRQRVRAELILADTTERALEAIGNRVPDLVLVPALLSPQDDAALAAALRVIAAAAHVRTLTIPVLAAHAAEAPSSGLLSRWRRGRSASPAPDGCDPAVFAEQISSYLKESAAERALRADDLENEVQGDEPQYAQEIRRDDVEAVEADANAYVQADAQPYQADVRHDYEPEVPAYVQPDTTYVQPELVQTYAHPGVVYTQPDVQESGQPDAVYVPPVMQAYAEPDAVYVPPEMQAYAEPDAVYVPPEMQADVRTDLQTDSEPDLRYSQLEMQPYSQHHVHADVQQEAFGVVEGIDYDMEAGSDGLTALRLNQEEDIDLSDELAVLEAEESIGMRETSEMELFDGEPVGVYTMPSVVDEPEIDAAVLAARKAFAEVEAAIEPASAAEAVTLSEFEDHAAVDPEFFAEPMFEAERRSEPVAGAAAASASAYTRAADSINPADAKRQPSDAEPWISSFLSPRWAWPAMEGPPTEPAAAFVHAEAAVAEARPAPAAHKRDRPEWSELVASLRKDIERRRVEPPQAKPKPDTQAPAPRRSRKSKPVQDEWGFFDPEQCGFAALLAKLDEITEGPEDKPVGQSSIHQSS